MDFSKAAEAQSIYDRESRDLAALTAALTKLEANSESDARLRDAMERAAVSEAAGAALSGGATNGPSPSEIAAMTLRCTGNKEAERQLGGRIEAQKATVESSRARRDAAFAHLAKEERAEADRAIGVVMDAFGHALSRSIAATELSYRYGARKPRAADFFSKMRTGGWLGLEHVPWFNGGLFDDDQALPLSREQILAVKEAADLDWADIDASIFGTLFERGLDPDKRSQLGAHYTDREKIMMIVEPVITEPLAAEWERKKESISLALTKAASAKGGARTKAVNEAHSIYRGHLERLGQFRVLDPACGSGNFLYLALHALKDLELKTNIEAAQLGLQPEAITYVGPESVLGIELNTYAAELARVTVWIGEIQWTRNRGLTVSQNPILRPLATIENRDAVLNDDGTEAAWPAADVIIGNPPFLGDRLLISGLGHAYSEQLRRAYFGRVPRGADFVCYWVHKAWSEIVTHGVERAGLVTTNSIRGGKNRLALDPISAANALARCWSDEPWVVAGAAVRVSIIGFGSGFPDTRLNGHIVEHINSDLTATAFDLTKARPLPENRGKCVHGSKKIGSFDIQGDLARSLLLSPSNPNGRPNSDVLVPTWNGAEVTGRPGDRWLVDFGMTMREQDAALYELPFRIVQELVKPVRQKNRNPDLVRYWWRHGGPRPALRNALPSLRRVIATPAVSKHRIFVFVPKPILPDAQLMVVLRDDDVTFGILQSRFHELWALGTGTAMGVGNDPRYTPSTTFDTFPFPDGLEPTRAEAEFATDAQAQAVAAAARELDEQRRAWLNPPELVEVVAEVVPRFPDRLIAKDEAAAAILSRRTLTALYNQRPAWLEMAHRRLDSAVAAAYGWPANLSDDEATERLFALNQERSLTQPDRS